MTRRNFTFFLLLIFCLSCKKEDLVFPDIEVFSPQEGAIFKVGEEIPFSIVVEDNEIIRYVKIALLSEDNKEVMPPDLYYPENNKVSIKNTFLLNDLSLPSGYYYLKIYAGDGNNEASAGIRVYLNEIPTVNLGLFILSETNSDNLVIYQLDTARQLHTWLTLSANYLEAFLDNRNHQMYIIPKSKGNLFAINASNGNTRWTLDRISSQSPYWFQGGKMINEELYVGDYNGSMKVYNKQGTVTNTIRVESNHMPKAFLQHGYYTYIYTAPIQIGRQKKICIYNYGFQLSQTSVFNDALINWFGKDDESVIVFHNNNNGIAISLLYHFYGNIQLKREIQGEVLHDVLRISETQFLLATDQGIWFYNLSTNTPLQMVSGENYLSLDYNKVTGLLAAATENEVQILSFPGSTVLSRHPISHNVKKVLWYNSK